MHLTKSKFALLTILAIPLLCQAQGTINTVAGTGTAGYSGDGGAATSAKIGGSGAALGVGVDNAGNLLIVDGANRRIRKVSGAGIITTVAGGGSAAGSGDGGLATAAQIFPGSVAVDKLGNMYIAQGNMIRKVDTAGILTTVAGSPTGFGYSGDGGPALGAGFLATNVAVDGAGNLYLADSSNQRIRKVDTNGIITTVAGNGTQGFSGDGGPATSAMLGLPQGLSVDSAGNLYFADGLNGRVRKVDTKGIITTVAGNGSAIGISEGVAATSTGMVPLWVSVDTAGNLYIVEGLNRIRKVNTAGIINTVAGQILPGFAGDGGPATSASLNGPSCVAVDGAGNIYIADANNYRVRKVSIAPALVEGVSAVSFAYAAGGAAPANQSVSLTTPGATLAFNASATSTGNWLTVSPGSGTTPANLTLSVAAGLAAGVYNGSVSITSAGAGNSPQSIAVTLTVSAVSAGNISTVAGNGLALYAGDGGPATSASFWPVSLAVDGSGNFFIGDTVGERVRKVNAAGTISTIAGNGAYSFSGDGGPGTSAALFYPYSIATDSAGNVYFGDYNNNRVRKVNTAGIISTVAGNGAATTPAEGVLATSTALPTPIAVAVDGNGNLYVADGVSRVRKVNGQGIMTTVAGGAPVLGFSGDGGAAVGAGLFMPGGLAVDASGNLYIADIGNQRIRKVNSAGVISTVAGTGVKGFSGDGGPATSAQIGFFGGHAGLAVDSAGNLYFTDTSNQRVRKVDTAGIITTVAGKGSAGYGGDGGAPNSASLNNPIDLALDTAGNLYIADGSNNRIRKFAVATGSAGTPPTISANGVVNGASFAPGIVPNSWATIQGASLAGVTDTWANAIVNGKLPTKLDGVSVTVGGQAAYLYYISPGQINFVVPDVWLGSVPVTVTTASGTSATFNVTSSRYGPAFFPWPNNQVVATRTDYTFAAKAGTFAGATTVAAKPGDVVVLWGTGFGPTSPAAPSGVQVPADQTYSTSQPVTVTVGGAPAPVYGAALASGFAGLYQVAIQVPGTLGDGDWPVVATVGGVSSGAGMVLSVKR